MCLWEVFRTYDPPKQEVRKAYKILHLGRFTPYYGIELTEDWLEAEELKYGLTACDEPYTKYPCGFHCYVDKASAKRMEEKFSSTSNIRAVEIDLIVAEGREQEHKVVVARKLRLLPKERLLNLSKLSVFVGKLFGIGR